ncbi:MAG: hypothetical protein IJU70_11990 [Lentisphaeria bacterium]|nr:hypothetical protein [Lentisphaeria bacterium]
MSESLTKKTKAELIEMVEALTARLEACSMPGATTAGAALTDAATDCAGSGSGGHPATDRETALREIVELSCQDHCPHRGNEDACRNCTIGKRLAALGL